MATGAPDWQRVVSIVPSMTAGAPDWERVVVGPGGTPIGGGGTTGFGRAHSPGPTTFTDATTTYSLVKDFVSGVVDFDSGSNELLCRQTGHFLVTVSGYYTTNAVISPLIRSGYAINGVETPITAGYMSTNGVGSILTFGLSDIIALSSGDLVTGAVVSTGASGTCFLSSIVTLTYLGA